MAEQEKKEPSVRILPRNELDFNLMTTNSVWGDGNVSQGLKDNLKQYFRVITKDEKGNETEELVEANLWETLGYLTRDLRLANLNPWNGEINYCQEFLNLAGDFLQVGMKRPFIISLSRVASLTELSQSKGGFLRKRMNTLTQEHFGTDENLKKKSLFGFNKKSMEG